MYLGENGNQVSVATVLGGATEFTTYNPAGEIIATVIKSGHEAADLCDELRLTHYFNGGEL